MRKEVIMEFQVLLKNRRSIRDFLEKEVSPDTVTDIIMESCLAPSSGNGQPWQFVVINRKETMKRLSDESKKNLLSDIGQNPDSPAKKYEDILRNEEFNVFYNAPCLVYVIGPQDYRLLDCDCSLFACYLMLAAAARGLGTCWIGLGTNVRNPELMREIGIPEDCRIVAPIIIGYPTSIPEPSVRNKPRILKVVS
jgi:nitroreductase